MARKKTSAPDRATPTIGIGDHVRLPAGVPNEVVAYQLQTRQEGRSNPIQGIVLSIRDVRSGQLVAVAAGDPGQYLFEVLQDRSFQPGFASDHNVGGKGIPHITANPLWVRLRTALRQKTGRGELGNQATGYMNTPPVTGVLDGWRLVKVRARSLENLDQTEEQPALQAGEAKE